jgi:recombination protein RecR
VHRDKTVICVVEGVGDIWALDQASVYHGLYHVLGGTLSALGDIGPEDLNLTPLLSRIREGVVGEVILALPATVDGATTVHWLTNQLTQLGVMVTKIGQGMPIGGALDALDDGTLAAALQARRPS